MNDPFTYPGYLERNGSYRVVCPRCHAQPMQLCQREDGRWMDGYTHIAREAAAREARNQEREAREEREARARSFTTDDVDYLKQMRISV